MDRTRLAVTRSRQNDAVMWLSLAPLVVLAAISATIGLGPLSDRLANDDQAYYLLVARNLLVRGPTYDGLYLTNGVHPLLAIVLGLLFRAPLGAWHRLAPTSVCVCVGFGTLFLWLAFRIRRPTPLTALGLATFMSFLAVYPILYRGMESALAIAIVASYLTFIRRDRTSTTVISLLSIALWMARIELLALPPLVALLGARAGDSPQKTRATWFAWLVSLSVFGAYALINYRVIGLFLPISGLIKKDNSAFLPLFAVLSFVFSALFLLALHHPRARKITTRARNTHALLAFAAVFYGFHAFNQPDVPIQTWYYFPLPLTLVFAALEVGPEVPASMMRVLNVTLIVVSIVVTLWEIVFVIPLRSDSRKAMQAVVDRAKRVAQPGERFMGPGSIGLLVGPEFEPFSLDGLVGGIDEYRAIRAGRLMQFAYESGVRFVTWVDPRWSNDFRTELVSEGMIPTGRSVWRTLRGIHDCGPQPCMVPFSIYRLCSQK